MDFTFNGIVKFGSRDEFADRPNISGFFFIESAVRDEIERIGDSVGINSNRSREDGTESETAIRETFYIDEPGENFEKWVDTALIELAATNGDFTKRKKLNKLPITEVYLISIVNRMYQGGFNGINRKQN